MKYTYIGLSKSDKEASLQHNQIMSLSSRNAGKIEMVFEVDANFTSLQNLIERVRSGDTILVQSIEKFGITPGEAIEIVRRLTGMNITIASYAEGTIIPPSTREITPPERHGKSKFSDLMQQIS